MSVTVTLAPGRSDVARGTKLMLSAQLMEMAQAMADECDGDVPIHVLDCFGNRAAVVGGCEDDDDVELF